MEKITSSEVEQKRIRFLNVINEGDRWFSFVVCETPNSIVIPYAWIDSLSDTTHAKIFNLAVEEFGFNEKYEPLAGGVVNIATCELLGSIQYGGIEENERIIKAVMHKTHCESI
ncbi:MAG: hypothetical protein QG551_314 [Patescibacteria group bacterium]|nr:hypothetical protein [Patescibacteria group bacterium]